MILEIYCKAHPTFKGDYPPEGECMACGLMFQILNFQETNQFDDGSELAVGVFPPRGTPSIVEVLQ